MNKFEKLIEYIINDEDQKARELFHEIVVEKSRDIYESIMDEESVEETVQGAEVEGMMDEVSTEEAMEDAEEGSEEFELGGDVDGDDSLDGEIGGDSEAEEHDEIEGKVMDIDAKLDELLAKFDEIMGNEEPAGDDFGGEEPAGDDFGGEEEVAIAEGEECDDEEEEEEEEESVEPKAKKTEESRSNKSTAEMMREYVDRIGDIYGGQGDASEGDAVAASGKKTSVNTKSITGPGADFGGNVVKRTGADNANPDGTSAPSSEKAQEIKSGNVNVPGGKAGSPKSTGKEYSKEHGAEGQTTDGKVPVATKSVQAQNTGKK